MRTYLKAGFRRLPVLIFMLLLMLCACGAENPDVATMEEASEGKVDEGKSHLGSLDGKDIPQINNSSAPHGLEEASVGSGTTPFAVQTDQETSEPEERLDWRGFVISESWKGVEISESCQTADNNLLQTGFTEPYICDLNNFQLFFDRFSEDAIFQISTTKFPLKVTTIIPPWEVVDPDQFGLLKEIKCLRLPQNSRTLPLFPIKEERERERYKFSYTLANSVATVHLGIEDTGFSREYIFTWDQCWKLSEIKDYST